MKALNSVWIGGFFGYNLIIINMKNINILKEWHEKYLTHLINKNDTTLDKVEERVLKIDEIIDKIENSLLPKSLYTFKSRSLRNWFTDIFLDINFDQVFTRLYDIATILLFIESLNNEEKNHIKDFYFKDEKQLPNYFFEIQTHYKLRSSGLHTDFLKSYVDSKGNSRPIDVFFEHNKVGYLGECLKVHNNQFLKTINLFKDVATFTQNYWADKNKRNIRIDSFFRAFIGIKSAKIEEKRILFIFDEFKKIFNKYHSGIMNSKDNIIELPNLIDENDFYIMIEMPMLKTEKQVSELSNDFLIWITVHGEYLKYPSTFFNINQKAGMTFKHLLPVIIDKIRRKIEQHKSQQEFKKIIFIEIEDTSLFFDGLTFALDKSHLNHYRIKELANKYGITIVFSIKRLQNDSILKEVVVIESDNIVTDSIVMEKLKNLT